MDSSGMGLVVWGQQGVQSSGPLSREKPNLPARLKRVPECNMVGKLIECQGTAVSKQLAEFTWKTSKELWAWAGRFHGSDDFL